MSRRPVRAKARRGLPLGLLLLLGAAAAPAQDMGRKLTFARRSSLSFLALSDPYALAGRTLFDSGPSDAAPAAGTLFFQGVSPDPGVRFQAGRLLGGRWAGREAEVHRRPDGRFWARAKLPPGAGAVSIRASDGGVTSDHQVEIYSVELIEEAGEQPDPGPTVIMPPARPPQPDAPRPSVHGRAEWDARPATQAYTPHPGVWRITLHHSDGRNTRTLSESLAEARFIQEYHQNVRQWIDIAYHFLVDEAGNVLEGRPEPYQGAHTLGNNEGNIGICLLGKYHEASHPRPTPAQLEAVARLARYLTLRYGIDPAPAFKGHRDYKSTDCPGDHAYARLPALRRAADALPPEAPAGLRPRVSPRLPLPARAPLLWDGR